MARLRLPWARKKNAEAVAKVLIEKLDAFMRTDRRIVWLTDPKTDSKVYVRKAIRGFESDPDGWPSSNLSVHDFNCLDIASVLISEDVQHSGVFTKFITHAESLLGCNFKHGTVRYVYVENTGNPVLSGFLEKRGYERDHLSYGQPSWFKTAKIG